MQYSKGCLMLVAALNGVVLYGFEVIATYLMLKRHAFMTLLATRLQRDVCVCCALTLMLSSGWRIVTAPASVVDVARYNDADDCGVTFECYRHRRVVA